MLSMFRRSLLKTLRETKKYKHNSTLVQFNSVEPIYPPPGNDLTIPPEWTPKKFFSKIGMGCE